MSTQVTALTARQIQQAQQTALDILGSFYGGTRAWTANEIITAKRLEARGWIPARAAYISTWLEESRDGAPWRHFTSQRDGICAVEKALEAIEARCGAEQHAPRAPKWEPGPEFEAHCRAQSLKHHEKVSAVQGEWFALFAEAEALGLKGHDAAEWCRVTRGQRLKGARLPGAPDKAKHDGSPAFGLFVAPDGRAFFNPPVKAAPLVVRTDAAPADAITAEYRVEDDEFPSMDGE